MQTARTTLPEFDTFRQQAIAPPMLRAARLSVAETLLRGLEQSFKFQTIGNDTTLRGGPCAQTATQRADLIIGIRLFRADLDHPTFDAHLTLKGRPEERHGRERPCQQLLALGAVVIGEEGKALVIQPFEQDRKST